MSAGHRVPYAGIATRAVALAIDAALAQVIVFAGGAVVALVGSLVGDLQFGTVAKIISGLAWLAVVGGWFVVFWTTAGQTPGMRLLGLRVVGPDGRPPAPARAVVRLIGLALAIVPLFAGFLPVLVDDRRRALQDFLARTAVLYDGFEVQAEPLAEQRVVRPASSARFGPASPRTGDAPGARSDVASQR